MSAWISVDYSVLLVVDNADLSRLAVGFMRAAPHIRLCIANDAIEAKAYLSGRDDYADRDVHPIPQVILLDIDLPQKSGLELLRWMKADRGLTLLPVIVLTSCCESTDVNRAYELGANSCLLKSEDEAIMHDIARGIGDYASVLRRRFMPSRESSVDDAALFPIGSASL